MLDSRKYIMVCVLIAVSINILLPWLVAQYVTDEVINPPNGASSLPFFDQILHMLVHHGHVPLSSSFLVGVIVALSVYGACLFVDKKKK